ncbi:hypothetical protein [Roseimaritima ulvae]|uniref:ATP-dependent RNA helicase RhlE n=2 Tax=Roseimaritima ulvae TaxID=980254 RepID=A0A5B9QPC4_9BACT|nr:hypothetical protein [Roseimaritima ulvae]QEG39520.1 ATP-dependent RNA helicase RhlE [Roseimaritima ulvae]
MAITFCTPEEHDALKAVEKLIGKRIRLNTAHPFHHRFQRSDASPSKSRRSGGKPGGGKPSGGKRTWKPKFQSGKKKRGSGSTAPTARPKKASPNGRSSQRNGQNPAAAKKQKRRGPKSGPR